MDAHEMLTVRTCASFDCNKPARPNWLRCDACLERIAAEKREALNREEELHREWERTRLSLYEVGAARPLIQPAFPAGGTIRSRIPYAEYATMPGENISRLKNLKRSPLHYQHFKTFPKESDALTLGNAAHVAILEPERFDRDHVVWMNRTAAGAMSPRKGKEWDAFVTEHEGQTILTPEEHEKVRGMANAVRGDSVAMGYLEAGDPEVTMQWSDGVDGTPCRGRVDWLCAPGGRKHLVGLKTTRDCRHFVFASQAAKLGYHLQWAFYADGYEAITGVVPRVVEIVVESAPPHAVVTYFVPPDILEQGREEYRELLVILAKCQRENSWPGPETEEQMLSLPSWVYESDDDLSGLGLE